MRTATRFFVAAVLLAAATAHAQPAKPELKTEVAVARIAPGGEGTVTVRVKLNEGWHVQSNQPAEDYLIPTVLTWEAAPAGIGFDGPVYPEAESFRLKGTTEDILVYGHDFTIETTVTVGASVMPGSYALAGTLRYQACDDATCIAPATAAIAGTLIVEGDAAQPAGEWQTWEAARGGPEVKYRVEMERTAVAAGESIAGTLHIRLDDPWHANANQPLDPYLIPTVLSFKNLPAGIAEGAVTYPEAHTITIAASSDPMAVYSGEFAIGFTLDVSEDAANGAQSFEGSFQYQACDDKACFQPQTKPFTVAFTIEGGAGGVVDTALSSKPDDVAATTTAWDPRFDGFAITGQASGYMPEKDFLAFLDAVERGEGNTSSGLVGVFWVILVAIGGGLTLNITPCVLPLIPINLAIIGAGRKAESKSRGFVLGLAYGLGIALVFGGLGLAFVLGLASFGGTINQSPWFNLAITVLFVAMALAMFDLITIDFSKFQSNINAAGKGGNVGFALFMGGVSALLAGACVAPVLVAVLLYSQDQYAKGHVFALGLPFLLGLGMAIPWPIVGAGVGLLPKPGAWMTKVKYVFGVVILGIASFYGWTTYKMFDNLSADPAAVTKSVSESGWETDLDTAIARAKAEGKPLFIDFWATWCKNCLVMNETVFKDDGVLARFDGYVKLKYQAEVPGDAPHAAVLAGFDQYVSFPFYAVVAPEGR